MYQRQGPKAFKKDLSNINALMDTLGHPERSLNAIHIAGTNGKGSVSHIIAGSLMAQGYKVGLYTSPHYRDFRERIKINGSLIHKRMVVNYVNSLIDKVQEIKPSFFELTVAMAFLHFKEQDVDYAVIETGLGGRLDSTNVVTPLISVITNISLDHIQFLGNTIPLIAREKAGIIKHGRPVVIGEKQEETTPVFEEVASERQSALTYAEEVVNIVDGQAKYHGKHLMDVSNIDIGGPFIQRNLITALSSLVKLRENGVDLSWKKIETGLKNLASRVGYIGRWQWIAKQPDTLVDSAHNVGGLTLLLNHLPIDNYNRIHFVLGFVNDKDLTSILRLFPKDATYYWAKADIPRGLDARLLKEKGELAKLRGKSYTSVRKALAAARKVASKDDLIFVGGSIFTVAEVV